MRKKVLAISLSLLFFGSIATSTFAMTMNTTNNIVNVDDDKDKNKKKAKSTTETSEKKSADCSAKKECCQKSCDEKKGSSDKK